MANMELITSVTVGAGGASSVTLPATGTIPQTYTDLKIVCSTRQSGNADGNQMGIRFNGSSASEYSRRLIYGDGSGAFSGSGSSESFARIAFAESSTYTANTFNNFEIYIPNYTSSNFKSFSSDAVSENNATGVYAQALYAGLWSNTAAITSITLSEYSGSGTNFVEGSTFYLYGISNANVGAKATGGIVYNDGSYFYHTFLSTGVFTPTQTLSCDYLVIAGGGGGGGAIGGGGGAGGYRTSIGGSPLSVTAQAYTITVGAGGVKGGSSSYSNGSPSTFSTITSAGGGVGGDDGTYAHAAGSGGSGGGGGYNGNGGSASPSGQGYAGGNGYGITAEYTCGGGGGAGEAGVNAPTNLIAGRGGNGLNTNAAWAIATGTGVQGYYAGGGGGGSRYATNAPGGLGGGGASPSNNGVANTGSGGGGAAANDYAGGGTGGSGIVIIRYAI